MTLYDSLNTIADQIIAWINTLLSWQFGQLVIFFVVVMLVFALLGYFWKIRK